jgi:hypothetical protein
VLTTVLPDYLAMFMSNFMTSAAVAESRPVVGSSKKIKLGFVRISTPIDVLKFNNK